MRATVYVNVDPKSQNSKGTGGVMIGTGGIIAVIARRLKHRRGKYRERQYFSESVKEKTSLSFCDIICLLLFGLADYCVYFFLSSLHFQLASGQIDLCLLQRIVPF